MMEQNTPATVTQPTLTPQPDPQPAPQPDPRPVTHSTSDPNKEVPLEKKEDIVDQIREKERLLERLRLTRYEQKELMKG